MIIRFAEINEYPEVLIHYKTCNYGGGVQNKDKVVIAIEQEIIGAVRVCNENNVKVLRGMQIKPAWQKKGIGSSMLKFLGENLDLEGCYCLPYKHLTGFYSLVGFEEISVKNAPAFLAERLEKYLSKGDKEIVIMMIGEK